MFKYSYCNNLKSQSPLKILAFLALIPGWIILMALLLPVLKNLPAETIATLMAIDGVTADSLPLQRILPIFLLIWGLFWGILKQDAKTLTISTGLSLLIYYVFNDYLLLVFLILISIFLPFVLYIYNENSLKKLESRSNDLMLDLIEAKEEIKEQIDSIDERYNKKTKNLLNQTKKFDYSIREHELRLDQHRKILINQERQLKGVGVTSINHVDVKYGDGFVYVIEGNKEINIK